MTSVSGVMRRLTGVVAWLLLLRVALTAGDLACADHAHGTRRAVASRHEPRPPMPHGMVMHFDAGASGQSAGAPGSCETPARAQCCEALASCGAAFVAGDAVVNATSTAVPALGRSPHRHAPASVSRGPEPPPPKA